MGRVLAAIGVVGALALVAAQGALAVPPPGVGPPDFGDRCTATRVAAPGSTAILFGNGLNEVEFPSHPPPEVPKVVTRWKVAAAPGLGPTPQQLVAFKEIGIEGEQVQEVQAGESALETVVGGGSNEFATRIPVPEYSDIGLRGPAGALVCDDQPGHVAGLAIVPWANGEVHDVKIEYNTGVPVIATVEPDRDGDGYGDATQDGCLEQPAVHTACPFVHLTPKAKAFKRGIALEVSTGDPTRVEVAGQVGWGYRPRGGGPNRRLVFGLPGGAQEVGKDATVGFWLPLPRQVIERLRRLPPKEKLKAHVTVVATDIIGHQTIRELTIRLPGWAKQDPVGTR